MTSEQIWNECLRIHDEITKAMCEREGVSNVEQCGTLTYHTSELYGIDDDWVQ